MLALIKNEAYNSNCIAPTQTNLNIKTEIIVIQSVTK